MTRVVRPDFMLLNAQINVEEDGDFLIGRCPECHKQVLLTWDETCEFTVQALCEHDAVEPEYMLIDAPAIDNLHTHAEEAR